MASTTTSQALMLLIIWGFPCEVSVPSFRRMTGACWEGIEEGEEKEAIGRELVAVMKSTTHLIHPPREGVHAETTYITSHT